MQASRGSETSGAGSGLRLPVSAHRAQKLPWRRAEAPHATRSEMEMFSTGDHHVSSRFCIRFKAESNAGRLCITGMSSLIQFPLVVARTHACHVTSGTRMEMRG